MAEKKKGKAGQDVLSLEDIKARLLETGHQDLLMELFALHVNSGHEPEMFGTVMDAIFFLAREDLNQRGNPTWSKEDLLGRVSFLQRKQKQVQAERERQERENGVHKAREKRKMHPLYRIGDLSHRFIQGIMNGGLPDKLWFEKYRYQSGAQLNIFSSNEASRQELQRRFSNLSAYEQYFVLHRGNITGEYLEVVRGQLDRLLNIKSQYQRLLGNRKLGIVEQLGEYHSEEFEDLKRMIFPIAGEESLKKLEEECFQQREALYHYYSSLLMWAQAFLFAGRGFDESPLFVEISALNTSRGTIGGRIDGVRVVSIDGKPLSKLQLAMLQQLARNWHIEKSKSAGFLVKKIRKRLGEPELEILEFKFCFGDGGFDKEIERSQVTASPMPNHLDQVSSYQTLASFDAGEQCLGDGLSGFSQKWFQRAMIIYFFDESPVCHEINLDEEGLRKSFKGFSSRWGTAYVPEVAEERHLTNSLINMAVSFYKGDPLANKRKNSDSGQEMIPNTQLRLFPGSGQSARDPLITAVEASRQYANRGKHRVIEVISNGSNGGKLALHYHVLCRLVERKWIESDNFQPETGGYVECLLKGHGKNRVMMQVNLEQGFFYCPHCQVGGQIVPNSIPRDLRRKLLGSSKENILLSERQIEVIDLLQRALADSFSENDQAKRFLVQKGLDPDFAATQAIGFGSINLVATLLEMDVELSELVALGLISFSLRASKNSELFRLLTSLGLKSREIQRKGARPVFRLNSQITLPTKLDDGQIVGICSASIQSGTARSLKIAQGLPLGAINLPAVKAHFEVEVVSGPLEFLSRTGNRVTIGVVDPADPVLLKSLTRLNIIHDGLPLGRFRQELLRHPDFRGEIRRLSLEGEEERRTRYEFTPVLEELGD